MNDFLACLRNQFDFCTRPDILPKKKYKIMGLDSYKWETHEIHSGIPSTLAGLPIH